MDLHDYESNYQADIETVDHYLNMRVYKIYVKSHGWAPDYEDTTVAQNKKEASENFALKLNKFNKEPWNPEDLLDYIEEEI